MVNAQVEIESTGPDTGRLVVDGVDVSKAVASCSLTMGGRITELALVLTAPQIAAQLQADVVLDPGMEYLLRRLGWSGETPEQALIAAAEMFEAYGDDERLYAKTTADHLRHLAEKYARPVAV